MTRWTAPHGGGYSGKGEPSTPPGPPPKNPGSATPQGRSKEAFVLQEALDSMRGRAEQAEAERDRYRSDAHTNGELINQQRERAEQSERALNEVGKIVSGWLDVRTEDRDVLGPDGAADRLLADLAEVLDKYVRSGE